MISILLSLVTSPFVIVPCVALLVTVLLFFFLRKRTRSGIEYASYDELASFQIRARRITATLLALCIGGIVVLSAVIASGSHVGMEARSAAIPDPNRRDTMIVFDISGSMTLVSGEKYQLARSALLRILAANPDEYIGLAFFSEIAFAPIPPTDDRGAFEPFTRPDFFSTPLVNRLSGGTDGSSGIQIAEQILAQSNAQVKRIVFISDLDDNDEAKLIDNLKQAQQQGIEIELIGIQTPSYVKKDQMSASGMSITEVDREADAEQLGSLPTSLPHKEDLAVSAQYDVWQLAVVFLVLLVFGAMIILRVYVQRPFHMRSNQ